MTEVQGGVDRTTDAVVDRHRQIAAGATLGAIVAETVEVTTTDAVDLTTAEVDIMTVMEGVMTVEGTIATLVTDMVAKVVAKGGRTSWGTMVH